MTLHLHRAPRTDQLADALGELLATPLEDPFAEEVVVVPAKGVERWLTQRLSHRLGTGPRGQDGVCAGVRFLRPLSLVSLLLGRERDDPWDPDRLVWPLLATIDESLDEPWCATLAAHLGHGLSGDEALLRRDRRFSVARRLAGLFASYAVQRPQLVAAWRAGQDEDGAGQPLDEDLLWQPQLWRRLIDRVDLPAPDARLAATLDALRAGGAGLDLPPRLSLFGHTRLPATEVELLGALATTRDVHLWLPQPSPVLWEALREVGGVVPRREDHSAELVRHPLLASLGRDSRELRRTLDPVLAMEGTTDQTHDEPAAGAVTTLLGWLQSDLRGNRAPAADERAARVLAEDDLSVQVHACHGSARQVEVLREVLVGILQDDPSMEPRDILVMCPDIETYAPLISAGFGLGDVVEETAGHPAHRLRVRLADRALSSTNPLLGVAVTVVGIAGSRASASEVLDLATLEPVRRRFRLTDDDLARITHWVGAAGVRWGIDSNQRAAFSMEKFEHNTWRSGLDRVLLGVAMSGDDYRHIGRGLPLDDVGSGDIDLAGRLAELVHRLDRTLCALAEAREVDAWMEALRLGVRSLTDVPVEDTWQVPQLEGELARAVDAAAGAASGVPLRLADVRAMLESRLGGRPTRANFRTGTLTVCTMVPMRSVPHRVVCLIGLDDGVYPRAGSIDGDDVLARRPLTGERDMRSEDRQLLLDAILAASEQLVITYTGANEHSGAPRPPAVPLGEILDALDRTASAPVRGRVEVHHPLQPYDARNLAPGVLVDSLPFSFDEAALEGAVAAAGRRTARGPFLTGPLPEPETADVSLADLKRFFAHPAREFLRRRLVVSAPLDAAEVSDAIPIDVKGLDQWQIGDRILRDVMAGVPEDAVVMAEQLRGTLPPGGLGIDTLKRIAGECEALWNQTAHLREGTRRSVDVDVELDGIRLHGTVTSVFGNRVVSIGYSRLKGKQRLATWIDLLALSAGRPDEHWTGHAVGKGKAGPSCATTGPLDHRSAKWLGELVSLYRLGMTAPLAAPVETACAWATKHASELRGAGGMDRWGDPVEAAWASSESSPVPGERDDAAYVRLYGDRAPLSVVEEGGLAAYAWQIWEPLLSAEKVGPL